jgi:hypothetical protein
MMQPLPRPLVLAISTAALMASQTVASSAQVVVQVDQNTRAVRLSDEPGASHIADLLSSGTLRFRRSATVPIQLVDTNTALYDITTEDVAAPPPAALSPIGKFLPLAKSYLPELAFVSTPRGRTRGISHRSMLPAAAPTTANAAAATAAQAALENAQIIERELFDLDDLIRGPQGINGVLGLSLRTLDRMRHGDVEAQAKALADSLNVPPRNCSESGATPHSRGSNAGSLTLAGDLLAALDKLHVDAAALGPSLSDTVLTSDAALRPLRASFADLRTSAANALSDSDSLLTTAYRVEHTADVVMTGCSHWESKSLNVSAAAGRIVTIKIEPRPDPEVKRVASDKPAAITVTLLPPLDRLDAKVGVSALYAPHAYYKTYGARPTAGSGSPTEIYETAPSDQRFAYGVTLGLTVHPWLDWRSGANTALWLPEITVAEAGSQHAFGLGTAISFGPVKIGVGAMVARHTTLVGDSVGQRIPNVQFLKTQDTYGHPVPYFSISIFDLGNLLGGNEGDASKHSEPPPSPGGSTAGKPAKKTGP